MVGVSVAVGGPEGSSVLDSLGCRELQSPWQPALHPLQAAILLPKAAGRQGVAVGMHRSGKVYVTAGDHPVPQSQPPDLGFLPGCQGCGQEASIRVASSFSVEEGNHSLFESMLPRLCFDFFKKL